MNELVLSNPKKTTQSALLERPLTWWRTSKIRKFIKDKSVLDFGCAAHLTTLRAIKPFVKQAAGYDILFANLDPQLSSDGIKVYGRLEQIQEKFDVVTALACFEHIERSELPGILQNLKSVTHSNGAIIGTVPRPPAKPVLEFLSYRLGLIDESQIRDHKIYYDRKTLANTVEKGGWTLTGYATFQFRFNSFFVLRPSEK